MPQSCKAGNRTAVVDMRREQSADVDIYRVYICHTRESEYPVMVLTPVIYES